MGRLSWEQYFMAQAHLIALRSTCTRLKVGAVLVRDNRIIASGYNGSISKAAHCTDEGCYVVDNHCIRTIHAEINALLQCAKFGVSCAGAELYVTHFPCVHCTKAIIQSGVKAVYYAQDYKNHEYAIELLDHAGILVKQVELEEHLFDLKREEKLAFVAKLLQMLADEGISNETLQQLRDEASRLFTSS